ncbi:MAG: HEPN domain-containing protein [Candidatus Limnocylindrales bacterium]
MARDEPTGDTLGEARQWLVRAEEDLTGATAMFERDDVAPRLACFLAQQAAEKALKARLIMRGVAFPRIHDLLALRALLPPGAPPGLGAADLAALSAWAVEARYPGDLPDATATDARTAIVGARAILDVARNELAGR